MPNQQHYKIHSCSAKRFAKDNSAAEAMRAKRNKPQDVLRGEQPRQDLQICRLGSQALPSGSSATAQGVAEVL